MAKGRGLESALGFDVQPLCAADSCRTGDHTFFISLVEDNGYEVS